PALEKAFGDLADAYPGRVGARIGYNDGLGHLIEPGPDIFLIPSRYEPCGLNQIYSLRYGTVPVVRATGGLQDTVDSTTGFKFAAESAEEFSASIAAALEAFKDRRQWLVRMRL